MLDLNSLDSLSRQLAERVLQQYPEWARFAEVEGEGERERTVVFKVPQSATGQCLWIDTESGEVTIFFAGWHAHESPWLEDSTEEADAKVVERSLQLLGQILNEEVVVVFETRRGEWAGSTLQEVGEDVPFRPGSTINVYSWRGTHDRVLCSET